VKIVFRHDWFPPLDYDPVIKTVHVLIRTHVLHLTTDQVWIRVERQVWHDLVMDYDKIVDPVFPTIDHNLYRNEIVDPNNKLMYNIV